MRIPFKQFSELQQAVSALTSQQTVMEHLLRSGVVQIKDSLLHIPMLRRESGKKSKQITNQQQQNIQKSRARKKIKRGKRTGTCECRLTQLEPEPGPKQDKDLNASGLLERTRQKIPAEKWGT